MYSVLRSLLFALPPEEAHAMALEALWPLERVPLARERVRGMFALPTSLETSAMGMTFRSPIGLAGGFDKNARRTRALGALGFGFLEVGTVTREAQDPNPPPNLWRLSDDRALVNRLGFPNEGAIAVTRRYAREVGRGGAGVPVGFSIGKSRSVSMEPLGGVIDDYLSSFEAVREVADFVVVNVSSPNTQNLRALQGAELAHALLEAIVRENRHTQGHLPVLLKVSPDMPDTALDALLRVVREVRLDGLVATNTTLSRAGLSSRKDLVRSIGPGGLSGPPLRHRALEVVRRAREKLGPHATVIGVGGIETGAHAHAFLEAGADLVQLYTGFIYGGPALPSRIARELASLRAS